MSDGMNRVMLLGNLGADPELRYTAAGLPVLNLRMATNESFLDRNKEPQERTEWHSVVVWGARAEALTRILGKGACILVEGWLRTSSYEKDGVKRFKTEVVAKEICLTTRRPAPAVVDDDTHPHSTGPEPLEEIAPVDPPLATNGASSSEARSAANEPALADPRRGANGPTKADRRPPFKNSRAALSRPEMEPAHDELPF